MYCSAHREKPQGTLVSITAPAKSRDRTTPQSCHKRSCWLDRTLRLGRWTAEHTAQRKYWSMTKQRRGRRHAKKRLAKRRSGHCKCQNCTQLAEVTIFSNAENIGICATLANNQSVLKVYDKILYYWTNACRERVVQGTNEWQRQGGRPLILCHYEWQLVRYYLTLPYLTRSR
jgi:hypothetical protein